MRKQESRRVRDERVRKEMLESALRVYGPMADVERIDEGFAAEFRAAYRLRNKSTPKGWSYAAAKSWMGQPLPSGTVQQEEDEE